MREFDDFTIFKRTMPSSKNQKKKRHVYCYYPIDTDGNRYHSYFSTGKTTLAKARKYCRRLLNENRLVPAKVDLTLAEFAENWWIPGKCGYMKSRKKRGFSMADSYAYVQRLNLDKHILPVFGKLKLKKITGKMIDDWVVEYFDKQGLSNKTANNCLYILKTMLAEACSQKLITENPAEGVKPCKEDKKKRKLITMEEFAKLFNPDTIRDIWSSKICCIASLLAASTGIRLGEVQGLQISNICYEEYLGIDYIHVEFSLGRDGKLKSTKTGIIRDIPIHKSLKEYLYDIIQDTSEGYVFSINGGESAIYYRTITDQFYKALRKIGISEEERRERNLDFHAWRHFFNTRMRGKIKDFKLQSITGHSTDEMTALYTDLDIDDIKELTVFQGEFVPDVKVVLEKFGDCCLIFFRLVNDEPCGTAIWVVAL